MPNLTFFYCLDEEVPVRVLRLSGESANNNVVRKTSLTLLFSLKHKMKHG